MLIYYRIGELLIMNKKIRDLREMVNWKQNFEYVEEIIWKTNKFNISQNSE